MRTTYCSVKQAPRPGNSPGSSHPAARARSSRSGKPRTENTASVIRPSSFSGTPLHRMKTESANEGPTVFRSQLIPSRNGAGRHCKHHRRRNRLARQDCRNLRCNVRTEAGAVRHGGGKYQETVWHLEINCIATNCAIGKADFTMPETLALSETSSSPPP